MKKRLDIVAFFIGFEARKMVSTISGIKIDQTQAFLEDGKRIPLSRIHVGKSQVSQIKTQDKDGYKAVQLAFSNKNKLSKPTQGHLKKAGIKNTPRFFHEVRVENTEDFKAGQEINIAEVLKPGDKVNVIGRSKGKGYAGVVKRHGFAGGPRTHGQSDRERAPGSIGASTTPGRVYKGKKMAGRMGNQQVTIKNLVVIDIDGETLFLKGLIPGPRGTVVTVKKVGESKNFTPLFKEQEEAQDAQTDTKEAKSEEGVEAVKEEKKEENVSTKGKVEEKKEEAKSETAKQEKEATEDVREDKEKPADKEEDKK